MERSVFSDNFARATARARDFARQFIEEPLPDALRFRVHLNQSYDGTATAAFKLFPEDSSTTVDAIDADRVIDVLWRDGWVPQWIDVAVIAETGSATVLDVSACGRFIDDEQRLYYTWTDVPPFGVKGPSLPVDYHEGDRFSLYERAICWSSDDLVRVGRRATKVKFLELEGRAFDDAALAALPTFPHLQVLELRDCRVEGRGLSALERLPRLRCARAQFDRLDALSFTDLPLLASLASLSLRSLPAMLIGVSRLSRATPNVRDLTLGSGSQTVADERIFFSQLDSLTLDFPKVPSWVDMPRWMRSLSLHAHSANDHDVLRAVSACPASLDSIALRGTPVSDAIFEVLARFPQLKYVDAVDTRVTETALEEFAKQRPGLKFFPRVKSAPGA